MSAEQVRGVPIGATGEAAGRTLSTANVASESDERTVNNAVRHQYRVLSDPEKAAMVRLKDLGLGFLKAIDDCVPVGRERSLARTKVEEAVMWAVKGLTQ
jgi:hypothetical protein